LVPFQM